MNTDLFPPLHSSQGSTATKSARLHVLIPPGANSREL
ncbi:MAG: hypothetical protein ACI9D0_000474, partial [Bacteroidia bacterium]